MNVHQINTWYLQEFAFNILFFEALYKMQFHEFASERGLKPALGKTEKLLFRFVDTLVRSDGVIPAWQNTMRLEINKCLLFV